jgi:hypothetical protein
MCKHTRARVVAACLGLFAFGAAPAVSSPHPGISPDNDLLDAASGLAWIRAAALQEMLDPGYRLAATGEARGLVYTAAWLSDGVFELGADPVRSSKANVYRSFAASRAIGYVAGFDDQIDLTGYVVQSTMSTMAPGILSGEGAAGTACLVQGCVQGLTPWGMAPADKVDADPGFFVDKAARTTAPEPLNARFWVLGLFTLGGLAVRQRP